MKKYNFLSIILLGIAITSCGDTKKSDNSLFSFDESKFQAHYVPQEGIELGVLNPNSKEVDSVVYFVNDTKIGSKKGLDKLSFALQTQKLGYQNLKAVVYYNGENAQASTRIELVSNIQPKLLQYKIINTYPHDIGSFTEGLEFYKDTLYESTGLNGKSFLRKYDYKTGKTYQQVDLDSIYFGEGITFINNKVYQLTWQEKTGFIYNANTLKLEKTFTYDKDIEGWGMTNDGKYIYQTDKTEKIWKMDPETQKMIDYVNVYSGNSKIKAINELEWINGKIYANVWEKEAIAVVDPKTGAVEGILDMSGLRKFITAEPTDYLNGIAYNPKTKTIFVTGKNWDKMFEITVSE
ncbi:Glutamine cyclotransferase [Flavobacterium fluvii]|uniref:Glutamine cyclotransferase n=1 Tax=Flavobacterium fluvii TaxID=468056 RepID=A0A1M5L7A9_9FLAO|nr:glutaminyl-peptide cyclotransferase [Flavobacterium fluvii]SHG60805.1 Glutamine cyclotransferase [Flavobacterium fluvii]